VLALVGSGGAGAHDLLRMAKEGRFLAWAGGSRYYVEPKRLAKLGYLKARKEPGKTRDRTVYALTERGLDSLREWVRTPVRFTPFKSEALLRILATDLVGEDAVREGFATLRDDLEDLRAPVEEAAQRAVAVPHREKYLNLGLEFIEVVQDYWRMSGRQRVGLSRTSCSARSPCRCTTRQSPFSRR
jgi:DNA-binding PadR family transcriptional regulator